MAAPARQDRNAIVQATFGRGGGGGASANLATAFQQFMATVGQSMSKMTKQIGDAHDQQAAQAQQDTARVADAAERSYNQAQQKAETQRKEDRQDAMTQDERKFQLQTADYHMALQQQVEKDAADVRLRLKEQEDAKERILEERENGVGYIKEANKSARDHIADMDRNHEWDKIEGGWALRANMLDMARTADAINEDYHNSPYSDKLHAMVAQADQAIMRGDSGYQSITGEHPAPPMIPVPKAMMDSLGLDLPTLTPEEAQQWKDRGGYPKGGLWKMSTDDPKQYLVNPVSYSAMMAMKQQDMANAAFMTDEARRSFNLDNARKLAEQEKWHGPLEDGQIKLRQQAAITLPDTWAGALRPLALKAGVAGVEQEQAVDPWSMVKSIYAKTLKNPQLMEGVEGLGLPEGDPKRWVPGQPKGPNDTGQAEDFFKNEQIRAPAAEMGKYLDAAYTDKEFRTNVEAWLGGLPASQLFQVGMDDDIAQAVYARKVAGRPLTVEDHKIMERAVSQVITEWGNVNRDRVLTPSESNNVMLAFQNSNHAAEVLRDATATSLWSHLTPDEKAEFTATGKVPTTVLEAENRGVYKVPLNLLMSTASLYNKPGMRTGLKNYMQGGGPEEEKKVFDDAQYNTVKAYYENAAKKGLRRVGPSMGETPGMRPTPHIALIARLHESRVRAKGPLVNPKGYGLLGAAGKVAAGTPAGVGKVAAGAAGALFKGGQAIGQGVGEAGKAALGEQGLMSALGQPGGVPEEPAQLAPQPMGPEQP